MYKVDFSSPRHLHFIGIGGISMSGLAEVLLDNGFTVSGSDSHESETTLRLRSKGADITIGQAAENITGDIDAVVYTAAIHPDNPELSAAAAAGLPLLTRAELLGQLMANYPVSIAVAGTHGKTTTTSMVTHILMAAESDPTVSVGGMLPLIGGNIRIGHSDVFLTEACEYTNSYHSLCPKYAVILNVDADHLDFFGDLDTIAESFHTFAKCVQPDGALILNIDSDRSGEVACDLPCRVVTVSMEKDADYTASDIRFDEKGCGEFTVLEKGQPVGTFALHVPGIHNISNALAVIALSRTMGIPTDAIRSGLDTFGGADRRFEYKGTMHGIPVIDDYAHHPTEIRATLSTALTLPHRELWVIFQPHTYSRTKALLKEFAEALSLADHVVLAGIYAAREADVFGVSSDDVAKAVRDLGTDAVSFATFEEIQDFVQKNCVDGDLLITMGAGNVTDIGPAVVD